MSSPLSVANLVFAPDDWKAYCDRQRKSAYLDEIQRRTRARKDLLEYIRYFHPDYIAEPFHRYVCARIMAFLNDIVAGNDPCLILEAPPRHGKSMICSDNLPSFALGWLMEHIARPQIIHVGYSQSFIDTFGRKNRDRLADERYMNLFPQAQISSNSASASHVNLTDGSMYHAAGMNAAVTGLGGHLLLLDDPVKGSDEANSELEMKRQLDWYMSVLATRAMDKCGKLLILTRWSNADIAGQVQQIAKQNPEADQWEVIKFPAIAGENDVLGRKPGEPLSPRRFPLKRLHRERAGKTAKVWSALYQQNPVPESGGVFSAEDVQRAFTDLSKYPDTSKLSMYVGGDFAIGTKRKNDYTVFWPFGVDENNHLWFLNDIRRFKGGGNEIVEQLISLAKRYSPKALILEDGHIFRGIRDALQQRMRETGQFTYIDAPYPTQDKVARAEPLLVRMQQGLVHLPDTGFVKDVVFNEFMAFGEDSVGVHDDCVDAMATGAMRLSKLRKFHAPKLKTPEQLPDRDSMAGIKLLTQNSRRTAHKTSQYSGAARVPLRLNGKPR